MAVLSGATASGRRMCSGSLTTTNSTVLYTSPTATANVTSPSATAYIKEIILSNSTSNAVTVTMSVGTINILSALTINPNDTKILSGLNIAMDATTSIQGGASTSSAIAYFISGVEIQ